MVFIFKSKNESFNCYILYMNYSMFLSLSSYEYQNTTSSITDTFSSPTLLGLGLQQPDWHMLHKGICTDRRGEITCTGVADDMLLEEAVAVEGLDEQQQQDGSLHPPLVPAHAQDAGQLHA